MNQNRKIKSKKRAVKAMALSMAAAMSMTLFPVSAFAEKAEQPVQEQQAEIVKVADKTAGNIHDYGKSGDDPTTPDVDESAVVANSDVLKSAQ